LRYSAAARHYRELVRTVVDEGRPDEERQKALRELEAQQNLAFTKEGMGTRIPRVFKLSVALSSFAVGYFFPPAAAAPILLELAEGIDTWVRNRNNIFEYYAAASYDDLYAELKRLFPHIRFQPDHLAHFLQHRHFGCRRHR
jgi:hypothetical protein